MDIRHGWYSEMDLKNGSQQWLYPKHEFQEWKNYGYVMHFGRYGEKAVLDS